MVFDPRRTATAQKASEHHAIRPGTDALFLAAVITTLFDEGLVRLRHLERVHQRRSTTSGGRSPRSRPTVVAPVCGIEASDIVELAREFAAADAAVAYGRLGTCTQEFGTLASWLVEALNVVTGNLDRPGGAMFGWPATGSELTSPGPARVPRRGRWTSRVRGAPEVMGELPVACLAEEITTPGPGQIRALLTVAGNPVLQRAGPPPRRRARTTRAAHRLRPVPERDDEPGRHRPARREPAAAPALPVHPVRLHGPPGGALDRADAAAGPRPAPRLAGHASAALDPHRPGVAPSYEELDDELFRARVEAEVRRPGSRLSGRSADEIIARRRRRPGPPASST